MTIVAGTALYLLRHFSMIAQFADPIFFVVIISLVVLYLRNHVTVFNHAKVIQYIQSLVSLFYSQQKMLPTERIYCLFAGISMISVSVRIFPSGSVIFLVIVLVIFPRESIVSLELDVTLCFFICLGFPVFGLKPP